MCQNDFLLLKNEEGDSFSFEIFLVLLEQFSQSYWMTMEEEPCSPGSTAQTHHTQAVLEQCSPRTHLCTSLGNAAKNSLQSLGTSRKAQPTSQHSFKNSFFSDRRVRDDLKFRQLKPQ